MGTYRLSLERLLQICVASMVVLATLLFGIGQHSTLLPLLAVAAAVGSVWLTDVTRRFQMRRFWANGLALASVVVWIVKIRSIEGEWQLLAVTHVLLLLQVILLFQIKSQRVYWQLMVLSIAQAAVASALTPGLIFGVLLLAYTVMGILALSLFLMLRETARFAASSAAGWATAPASGPATRGRARLLGAAILPETGWEPALARQTLGIGLGTVLVTVACFVLFPRVNHANDEPEEFEELARTVGFSREVTLGDEIGLPLENPDVVMRFELFEGAATESFQLHAPPLLRGSVASNYEHGKWRPMGAPFMRPMPRIRVEPYVRQRITIEPREDPTLFCVTPAFSAHDDERLWLSPRGDQVLRRRGLRRQRLEFDLATTGIRDHRQIDIVPVSERGSAHDPQLLQMPAAEDGGRDPLAGLRAAAEQVRTSAGLATDDRLSLARALCAYLRDSGTFRYSLTGQKRKAGADPLEDFVVSNRRGHCEYFAGALALMLRSQGIPARVATGYKAQEWNSAGGYYQVRELHAHAWVEAYLERKHYAQEKVSPTVAWNEGAWLVLDPTVSGDNDTSGSFGSGLFGRTEMYFDYLQVLWGKYVQGLSGALQREAIYQPLRQSIGDSLDALMEGETYSTALRRLGRFLSNPWAWYRQHWFSVRGAVLTLLLLGVLAAAYRGVRWTQGRWRPATGLVRRRGRQSTASNIAFYRRLEIVLARRGWTRAAGQTPYEFATTAGGELAETISLVRLASLPRRVVEAFYRVRFGGRSLDSSEAEAVEHALVELERGL